LIIRTGGFAAFGQQRRVLTVHIDGAVKHHQIKPQSEEPALQPAQIARQQQDQSREKQHAHQHIQNEFSQRHSYSLQYFSKV
jgi:F0F1-type ATP synthase epsilon subunit